MSLIVRTSRTARTLAAILITAAAVAPAAAQSTGHSKHVTGRAFLDGALACTANAATLVSRSCSAGSASAEIHASVGSDLSLHARALVYDSWIMESEHVAFAEAMYSDRLTFVGEVIPEKVRFSMYLHGGAGNKTSYGELSLYHSGPEPRFTLSKNGTEWGGHGTPAGYFPTWPSPTRAAERGTFDLPVIGGRVDFALALRAMARMVAPLPTEGTVHCGLPGGCMGMGVRSDFHETAFIEMLTGIDANGEAILGGLQVQVASGHAYSITGVAATTTAPEPASLALVGTGMLGIAIAGARRRQREIL